MTQTPSIPLELFINHLKDAVVITDLQGRFLHFNSHFQALFSTRQDDLSQSLLLNLLKDQPLLVANIEKVLQTGGSYYLRDIVLCLSNDFQKKVDVEVFPLISNNAQVIGMAVIFHERMARGHFEEQERRMDRIHYLSTIAAGLAHEIRNPLSGIKGASQLLAAGLTKRKDLKEYADIIQREVVRVDALMRNLLHFTKPKKLIKKPININKVLHHLVVLQSTIAPDRVLFEEHYDPSLPKVRADAQALSQIFLNLLKNAREAVDGKGGVEVRSHMVTDYVLKKGEKKRQVIAVDIKDSGSGIDAETEAKIFVPFFTTKAKGTGLGLALCHQLIEEHEGDIRVKSEKGNGTTFSVYLPV